MNHAKKVFGSILVAAIAFVALSTDAQVHATLIFGEQPCEGVSGGSEPMSTHLESRYARYLRRAAFPRTYGSQEELERWCYLWEEKQQADEDRRATRLDLRDKTQAERFNIFEDVVQTVDDLPAFDIEGVGSEPLEEAHREIRMQERAKSDNCSRLIIQEEIDRCTYLIRLRYHIRDQAVERRRLARARSRTIYEPSTRTRPTGIITKSAEGDRQSLEQQDLNVTIDFDPDGPGSDELSESEENRIMRYVENGSCSRLRQELHRVRCEFLVKERQYNQSKIRIGSQSRAAKVTGTLRRGVYTDYRRTVGNAAGIERTRQESGFRPTPRTIREAQENFQDPITVPGDCQIDENLCNK